METVLRPPDDEGHFNTINFNNIIDFIPIENNADAFGIGSIITEVSSGNNEEKKQEIQQEVRPQIDLETAVTPVQMREIFIAIPNQSIILPSNLPTTTFNTNSNITID